MHATDFAPMPAAEWLAALGALTATNMPIAEGRARVAAYRAALASEFDPGAFCAASLRAVARGCKFFPSFGEVCEALSAWWRDHRATVERLTALPGPGGASGRAQESRERYEPVYGLYKHKYGHLPHERFQPGVDAFAGRGIQGFKRIGMMVQPATLPEAAE